MIEIRIELNKLERDCIKLDITISEPGHSETKTLTLKADQDIVLAIIPDNEVKLPHSAIISDN